MNENHELGTILPEKNIFFIVGLPHSGTTIVYRLIGRHPSVGWFSQFSQRSGTVPRRFPLPFWGHYNRLARNLLGVPWKKKRGIGEYIIPRPMEANRIWEYLLPTSEQNLVTNPVFRDESDISPAMVKRFKTVFKEEFRQWKKPKMICKLPRLTREIVLLNHIFENVKFLHLIRDGRAVSYSLADKFARRGLPKKEALIKAANYWKKIINYVEFNNDIPIDDNSLLSIKLEDFQRNYNHNMTMIFDFFGLNSKKYAEFPEVKSDTNEKWRNLSEREEVETIEGEIGNLLDKLNYNDSWY